MQHISSQSYENDNCRKYLDPGFSEVDPKRQFLAAEHVGVVGLLEHVFQLIQLEAGERRTIATLFALRRLMLSISFASHKQNYQTHSYIFTLNYLLLKSPLANAEGGFM